jgi:hypothetical protein
VTTTVYVLVAAPSVTIIDSTFSPADHVIGEVTTVSPNLITTFAELLTGTAVTVLVALVVAAVYVVVPVSNAGVNDSEPIRSSDRSAFKGL